VRSSSGLNITSPLSPEEEEKEAVAEEVALLAIDTRKAHGAKQNIGKMHPAKSEEGEGGKERGSFTIELAEEDRPRRSRFGGRRREQESLIKDGFSDPILL
jgi:hypothetical protein